MIRKSGKRRDRQRLGLTIEVMENRQLLSVTLQYGGLDAYCTDQLNQQGSTRFHYLNNQPPNLIAPISESSSDSVSDSSGGSASYSVSLVTSFGNLSGNVALTGTLTKSAPTTFINQASSSFSGFEDIEIQADYDCTLTLNYSVNAPPLQNTVQTSAGFSTSDFAFFKTGTGTHSVSMKKGDTYTIDSTLGAEDVNFPGIDVNGSAFCDLSWKITSAQKPDIAMDSAKINGHEIDYNYHVTGAPGPFTVGLYQASSQAFDYKSDKLLTTVSVNAAANSTGKGFFDLSHFTADPAHPYLLVVADAPSATHPNGNIAESDETNNVAAARFLPSLLNSSNVQELATVIMSEASVGNKVEQTAVGWTVTNRMLRDGTTKVSDVWSAYAHNQAPTQPIINLARSILSGASPDPTGGATHYYSPRSFRVDQLRLVKTLVNGHTLYTVYSGNVKQDVLKDKSGVPVTEQTPGLPARNYIPRWAPSLIPAKVAGARPAYFKFYRAPGNGPVK